MEPFKILDGAMGSELIRKGLTLPKYIWSSDANITNPEIVQEIHREHIDAGADYITANTFRTTPRSYLKTGASYDVAIHKAKDSLLKGVRIAQTVACNSVKIIGSIAPLEDCYSPNLFPGKDTAIVEFSQLGKWLAGAGVDILLLETMNSLVEIEAAIMGIKNLGLPIWVSFVLKDDFNLLSGDSISKTIEMVIDHEIDCLLLNCNPITRTLYAAEYLVSIWPHKWGVYPNLGIGEPSPDGHILNYEIMSRFLSTMRKIIKLRPAIVGACCGSNSEHIIGLKNLQYEFSV